MKTDYLSKLKKGAVLISADLLEDPHFSSTLVLVCHHDSEGSYGLVLNRVAHIPLGEIFDVGQPWQSQTRVVNLGGPVAQTEVQIVHITDNPVPQAIQIGQGVYLGGVWEDMQTILENQAPQLRLFLGYAGWAGGQLEEEIKQGAWEVYQVPLAQFLFTLPEPWSNGVSDLRLKLSSDQMEKES